MDSAVNFTLIGERLNTHREEFRTRVQERDTDAVVKEVQRQQRAGATHLDFNTSGSGEREIDDMLWLLGVALPLLKKKVGVVIDSPDAECLSRALQAVAGRPRTIINAITMDFERLQKTLPLIVQHGTGVVAILGGPGAPPRSSAERLSFAEQMRKILCDARIADERQYFDPQVLPLAYDAAQPRAVLETVVEIRKRWPGVHALAGLSNVSFNLANRRLLNRTYLAMLLGSGVNALLCDPCDRRLRQTLLASKALMGQDDFFATYLSRVKPDA